MMDFDLLMNKYKDKIVIVDKKEPTTEMGSSIILCKWFFPTVDCF